MQTAHILTAEALGRGVERDFVAGHEAQVDDCRGVVPRIFSAQGIRHHGTAQVAALVSTPYAPVDRLLKVAAHQMDVLSQIAEQHRHARVLTNRNVHLFRRR